MIDNLLDQDRAIGDRAAAWRDSAAMKIIGPASDIADQWQLFTLCVAVAGYGTLRRDRRLAGTGVRMAAAMLAATALKDVVKGRIDRTRPLVVAQDGEYVFRAGRHDVSALNSFPSGHTAGAVAVARVIASRHPAARTAALGTAAAVAIAQVPRGRHYPLDLMAGCLVGLVAGQVVRFAARQICGRSGGRLP